MPENEQVIPFYAHEAEVSRHERVHKRDFAEKIILILLLILTNAGWLLYESQWQYTETTQEVRQNIEDVDGATIIGIGENHGED